MGRRMPLRWGYRAGQATKRDSFHLKELNVLPVFLLRHSKDARVSNRNTLVTTTKLVVRVRLAAAQASKGGPQTTKISSTQPQKARYAPKYRVFADSFTELSCRSY